MQETWVIPGLGRSPGEGTHSKWPGEFHGLYIVHEVTKIPTQLSDFHFHFDIWPLAGWLKKQKMIITPIYLAPGQVKARWDWKEGGGMACLLWERRHWEGGEAKGPRVKTPADMEMGQGRAPRGLWAEAEAMLGEVIQPVCCLSHRGGAEGDTPTQTCGKAVAGRFKQQSCDPEQSKPQRESGETVQTNKEPSGLRPSSEGPGVTDHREQVAGTTDSPGNPDFTILSTKIPLLSPTSSYP